jgi:toxin ParE1/3/4
MLQIVLDEDAERDLVEIWTYIAKDNPNAADRVLDLIDRRLESLAEFPRFGEARPDLAPDLRCYPAGSYVIFYRPTAREIQVARVLHGARDALAIFRRR